MVARPCVVAVALLMAGSVGLEAQSRRASMLPAELPPPEFADSQYVDSRGCAFVRAGVNDQVTWLPLFDENRQPLCGLDPSTVGGAMLPGRVVIRNQPETTPEPRASEQPAPPTETATLPAAPATPGVANPPISQPAPQTAGDAPGPASPPPVAAAEATAGPTSNPPVTDEVNEAVAEAGPVVIVAAGDRNAAPRYTLRVIERRGTIIEVEPDPTARSPLRVIEQRGTLFYPDA